MSCWSILSIGVWKGFSSHHCFQVPEPSESFFSRNHPWLLWDVCEPLLPATVTNFPGCSPDLYSSSHPAKHTSVYMHHSDIWCCLSGLSDLAAYVCWETEVNLGPCLFSPPAPFLQGLINIWILLGLTFVLLLGLASVHNDNFLLNCFCCTLPVSLPFQKKWLQSKYQSRTVWLPARVKSDHRALWFYPASDFTSDGFQFWAKVYLLWGEHPSFQLWISTHSQRWTQLQDNLRKLSTHLNFITVREE